MEIKGPETLVAMRLFETLQIGQGFKCCCCLVIFDTPKMAAYVEAYKPRDPIMKKAMPPQNAGAYVVCVECAELPEDAVFKKAQEYVVANGILQTTGLKPLDKPGRHTPKRRKLIEQDTIFRFGEGRN